MNRYRVIYDTDVSELIKAERVIRDLRDSSGKLKKEAQSTGDSLDSAGKRGTQGFKNLKNAIGALGLLALAREAWQFQKRIIAVTAEMQKFEAVLTVSLGSKSAARQALNSLVQFAAKTPFSVQQLTQSFVKLTNQGLQPTISDLEKIGDLASSTGKTIDQLTEAILDATAGEFERLKEFGVRAKSFGDVVQLTFKGVTTEVEKSRQAINDYLLSLGELDSVSGSMEAISRTLGGALSNLKDNWEQLLNTIGSQESGVLLEIIQGLTRALSDMQYTVLSNEQLIERAASQTYEAWIERVKEMKYTTEDLISKKGIPGLTEAMQDNNKAIAEAQEDYDRYNKTLKKFRDEGLEITDEERKKLKQKENILISLKGNQLGLAQVQEWLTKTIKESYDAEEAAALAAAELNRVRSEQLRITEELIAKQQELMAATEAVALETFFDNLGRDILSEVVNKDYGKVLSDNYSDAMDEMEKDDERRLKQFEFARQEEERIYRESEERKQQIRDQLISAGAEILEAFNQNSLDGINREIDALNHRYDQEIGLAGENKDARLAIEREYEEERERLEQERIRQQKAASVRSTLINTAQAIVKTFAEYGFTPLGATNAAIVAGIGAAQIAAIQGFKDGVIDLQGPGTGTSDSILARLSKGESVVRAKTTKKSKNVLRDLEAGKLDDRTYKMLVETSTGASTFNDANIVNAIMSQRFPDFVKTGNEIHEVRRHASGSKTRIRRKILG